MKKIILGILLFTAIWVSAVGTVYYAEKYTVTSVSGMTSADGEGVPYEDLSADEKALIEDEDTERGVYFEDGPLVEKDGETKLVLVEYQTTMDGYAVSSALTAIVGGMLTICGIICGILFLLDELYESWKDDNPYRGL